MHEELHFSTPFWLPGNSPGKGKKNHASFWIEEGSKNQKGNKSMRAFGISNAIY